MGKFSITPSDFVCATRKKKQPLGTCNERYTVVVIYGWNCLGRFGRESITTTTYPSPTTTQPDCIFQEDILLKGWCYGLHGRWESRMSCLHVSQAYIQLSLILRELVRERFGREDRLRSRPDASDTDE